MVVSKRTPKPFKILVTGGAGFIGSAYIRNLIGTTDSLILNLDKLTYAGDIRNVADAVCSPRYFFQKVDICDAEAISLILTDFRPDAVIHFAAESHVDNSISSPNDFITTNVVGTLTLLNACFEYWSNLPNGEKQKFRFHHISTDEVYGDLPHPDDDLRNQSRKFTECSRYEPSSPYSASKASSDHLVRAWGRTFGLPFLITNCSNNYGPYQHCEKLIPLCISKAVSGEKIPVYGTGTQIRDWLHVNDHVEALKLVLERGNIGETYNIGGGNEIKNITVVQMICKHLNKELRNNINYENQITFVDDRAGHDRRYAIDCSKIKSQLGWAPTYSFDDGLSETVHWYINHPNHLINTSMT